MKHLIFTTTLLFTLNFTIYSQISLFSEDFETGPVTSILNTWNSETQLTDGPSPCSLASRGDTSDFNSSNVDFKGAQNDTYYLGVNPESPCGGFYNATVATSTMDFSGTYDSIVFSARYYIGITLGWGAPQLEVVFNNGTTTDTISDEFSQNGNWLDISYKLPSSMNAASVDMTINLGGGEGVAMDDIEVTAYSPDAAIESEELTFSIYPNPANDVLQLNSNINKGNFTIYNISGQKVKYGSINSTKTEINVADLTTGIYFVKISDNKAYITQKLIIK